MKSFRFTLVAGILAAASGSIAPVQPVLLGLPAVPEREHYGRCRNQHPGYVMLEWVGTIQASVAGKPVRTLSRPLPLKTRAAFWNPRPG